MVVVVAGSTAAGQYVIRPLGFFVKPYGHTSRVSGMISAVDMWCFINSVAVLELGLKQTQMVQNPMLREAASFQSR